MDGNALLETLKTNLQAAMPDLDITRSAEDFAQRPATVRRKGVVTLVSDRLGDLAAQRDLMDLTGKLQIYMLYEFERPERTPGVEIEQLEWQFIVDLIAFLQAPGAGLCALDAHYMQLSQQRSAPQGWVFAQLEYSELES